MVCVTLKGLWMIADRIVDFRCFVTFHKSGPAIIFSFWNTKEHVSKASKKLLIKVKTSTWWMLLWKYYGWFLMELSIFDFFFNFRRSGPAKIFNFWTTTVHVSYTSKKTPNEAKDLWVCYSGRIMVDFWQIYRFSIFCQISQVRTCNNFQVLKYHWGS